MLPGFIEGVYSWRDVNIDLYKLTLMGNIRFINDEVTNLTAAVKSILDPDKTGKTYNGVVFWKYKGETLWDRRKRIRGE